VLIIDGFANPRNKKGEREISSIGLEEMPATISRQNEPIFGLRASRSAQRAGKAG
jgi:hypothetical protein